MASSARKQTAGYVAVVAGCFIAGLLIAWTPLATRFDNDAYDTMLSATPEKTARSPESVVVAIDERTLSERGGPRRLRTILTETLDQLAAAKPKVVALDITLHDPPREKQDEVEDIRLAAALRATKNLILPCDLVVVGATQKWEEPFPLFAEPAVALGHVHQEDSGANGVTRRLPLEVTADGQRRWALALEAFRVARGAQIIESPVDLEVAGVMIPVTRDSGRAMYIRYRQAGIPTVSALDVAKSEEKIRGKTVFLGITALSMARDRVVNPYSQEVAGVEVHAHAYETLVDNQFRTPAKPSTEIGFSMLFAITAALIFKIRSSWIAYPLGGLLLLLAVVIPFEFFRHDVVFRFTGPFAVAALSIAGAASYQHFFVRRQLLRSESEKSRYQQAIHWAAHEMRTPLTAIQGSSEIMTRYTLPEEKRAQLSEMINSESKRLARMIQTFLDVERLADGEVELKREPFAASVLVETCLSRARPIAERKKISMFLDTPVEGTVTGDRELLEYALYNLLTNAVKYSPSGTEVHVSAELTHNELRLAVRDQGIGMDAKELKSIFKKFYRTKRAEASGEVGTGIGLSIVEQIVTRHGGRIEVTSQPGQGSCFTMIVTASETAAPSHNAQTSDRRG